MTKTMDWTTYIELASRTAKPLELFEQLEHARLGVSTEVGELLDAYKRHRIYGKPLDKTNLLEEIGDTLWYVALECTTNKFDIVPIMRGMQVPKLPDTHTMLKALGRLAGYFWDEPREGHCAAIVFALMQLCEMEQIDFEQAMRLNIAKLAKRYGDKYSDHAALVRDLVEERTLLEAGKA